MNNQQRPITCSACGNPYQAEVHTLVDVGQNPALKQRVLNGTLNNTVCPNCGSTNKLLTPILYHDPTKELLIAMVPMEVNMTKDQQEMAIGEMMKQLPKENFKSYMFSPRRALTMQGLTEQILQADGYTPEMIKQEQEQGRKYGEIIQQLLGAQSEEAIQQVVDDNDDDIDEGFFQHLGNMAQQQLDGGRPDIAQQLLMLQSVLTQYSSFGQEMLEKQRQIITEVQDAIEKLGNGATRDDFFDLALTYTDQPDHLRALARIAQPVFDQQFFQEMNFKIGGLPAAAREKVETMREQLQEQLAILERQAQSAAVNLLQAVVNHPQPAELLRANIQVVDDTFMQVLEANIQHAESRSDVQTTARLKEIKTIVDELMGEMQHTSTFLQQLVNSQQPEELLRANLDKIDDNLLTMLALNVQAAEDSGDTAVANHFKQVYNLTIAVLQDNMQPELKFVNQLLTAEDDDAKKMLKERAEEFGPELLEVFDAIQQAVTQNGGDPQLLARLQSLRKDAAAVLEA